MTKAKKPQHSQANAKRAGGASRPDGKIATLIRLMRRPEGASIDEMTKATGWKPHSVRGAISGSIKKSQRLTVASEKTDASRVYRIVEEAGA